MDFKTSAWRAKSFWILSFSRAISASILRRVSSLGALAYSVEHVALHPPYPANAMALEHCAGELGAALVLLLAQVVAQLAVQLPGGPTNVNQGCQERAPGELVLVHVRHQAKEIVLEGFRFLVHTPVALQLLLGLFLLLHRGIQGQGVAQEREQFLPQLLGALVQLLVVLTRREHLQAAGDRTPRLGAQHGVGVQPLDVVLDGVAGLEIQLGQVPAEVAAPHPALALGKPRQHPALFALGSRRHPVNQADLL
jgi:hypothetical protein